eukprot:1149718-Pelagomonas_calceolata.AAC.1
MIKNLATRRLTLSALWVARRKTLLCEGFEGLEKGPTREQGKFKNAKSNWEGQKKNALQVTLFQFAKRLAKLHHPPGALLGAAMSRRIFSPSRHGVAFWALWTAVCK